MCVRVNETVVFYRTCVTPVRSYLLAKSGRTSRRSRSRATAQARDRRGRSAPPTTRRRASSPRKPATSPVSHPSIDSFQSLTALPPFNALRLSYLARTYSCTPKFVSAYFLAVLCTCTPPFLSTSTPEATAAPRVCNNNKHTRTIIVMWLLMLRR